MFELLAVIAFGLLIVFLFLALPAVIGIAALIIGGAFLYGIVIAIRDEIRMRRNAR